MHKSEAEMQAAGQLFGYEWRQYSWAAETIRNKEQWFAGSGTGFDPESDDGVVEVFLLHARNLRDFFGRRRVDLKWFEETDVLAEDFFDDASKWVRPALPYLCAERERLNRALSHISYDRLTYNAVGGRWDYSSIDSELNDARSAFLTSVGAEAPERKNWLVWMEKEG